MQRRRFLLSTSLALPLLTTACTGNSFPREVSMTTAQLQATVAGKFPKNYPVAGLLQLALQAPALSMLPASNQIRAVMPAVLSGPVLKDRYQGHLDVSFGLQYVAADRTLRAQRVQVNGLEIDNAPPALQDMVTTYAPRAGEQIMEGLVLYQLEDKDLALADAMGVQPGVITVTPQGLTMVLDKKPL